MCFTCLRTMAQTGRASPDSSVSYTSRNSCSSDFPCLPLSQTTRRSFDTCEWTSKSSEDEWKVCNWSDDEVQVMSDRRCHQSSEPDVEWEEADWSPSVSSEAQIVGPLCSPFANTTVPLSVPPAVVMTPSRKRISPAAVRRSPRKPKRKTPIDTNCSSEDAWQVFTVIEMDGCEDRCATLVHGLTEFEIIQSHAGFSSKTSHQRRQWLFDYFASHCPLNEVGTKDPNSMSFLLCGKEVCQPVWLATFSISQSRFYEVRKEFLSGQSQAGERRSRSLSAKSQQAIAWMRSYFDRVGDKRPDKDGIYLPSCLTERSIYNYMVETLYKSNANEAVCFSQFNKLYRKYFPNVSIPKVR